MRRAAPTTAHLPAFSNLEAQASRCAQLQSRNIYGKRLGFADPRIGIPLRRDVDEFARAKRAAAGSATR